jgi:hypothetical protein
MADREPQQHARDAGGSLEPGHDQLRKQDYLLRPAHFRPDATPLGWSSRNQPGPSCVGSDGETQFRKSPDQGAVPCRTCREPNAVLLWRAQDVEPGWTRCSPSPLWQRNRA